MIFFFIGFMGSGKSFFAQEISNTIQIPFVDMDIYIQEKESISIAQIFEQRGEDYFRLKEHEILKSLIQQYKNKNVIIATGGGAPCYHNNMELMNHAGITIYFDLSINMLCQLLKNETEKRPLLKNLSEQDFFLFIQKKLSERKSFYQKATISLSETQVNKNSLVHLIQKYV